MSPSALASCRQAADNVVAPRLGAFIVLVLATVAAEFREIASLIRNWRAGLVLLATFGVTVLHDLMAGIAAGCLAAALCWLSSRIWRRLSA